MLFVMTSQKSLSSSPLERLPLLALEEICAYLSHIDTRRQSLFAFSQVSSICCDAAKRERFECVLLIADYGKRMEYALKTWRSILAVNDRSRLVRRVKIIGSVIVYSSTCAGESQIDANHQYTLVRRHRAAELKALDCEHDDDMLGGDDTFSRPQRFGVYPGSKPDCTKENNMRSNKLWRPVAEFIATLPGLKDLIWASTDQVPRCILDVLHASLPRSRLRVHTFSLRSLYENPDGLIEVDPDEYALASSPNLYSVRAMVETFGADGRRSYNKQALQQIIAGIAPNLRRASITITMGRSIEWQEVGGVGRPSWPGLFAGEHTAQTSKSCLESLALDGGGTMPLGYWTDYIDMSKLRCLELLTTVDTDSLVVLTEMAERNAFPKLDALSIRLGEEDPDTEGGDALSIWSMRLFSALPPLRELFVRKLMATVTTSAMLKRHGASLRRLQLSNIASLENIQQIRDACPELYHLRIGIQRSRGDKREVEIYKTIGSIPRLRSLSLSLHYVSTLRMEGQSNEEISRLMQSELSNAAQDADLARAIFNIIFTANSQTRPGTIPAFYYMKTDGVGRPMWNGDFAFLRSTTNELAMVASRIARSWSCERQRADGEGGDVIIEETGQPQLRAQNDARLEKWGDRLWTRDEDHVRPAWWALWPESRTRDDWIHVWHSMPLVSD